MLDKKVYLTFPFMVVVVGIEYLSFFIMGA
jgi:hypothetical protein